VRTDPESKKESGFHKKVSKGTPSWKIEERDEKPCSAGNWSALGSMPLPCENYNQPNRLRSGFRPANHQTVLNGLKRTNQR